MTQDEYNWLVMGNGHLHGKWEGWRIAGRELIAPDGSRIPQQRIRGLIFRQDGEARVAAARARRERHLHQTVRVVVITLSEFRSMRHGAA